ncbi:zinc-binding dehydrogenase [Nonomuraea sp. KC401]|uniref:zinc-binding dehydrogenase n=1 Tax=unclassified Nonomuraea TaxID=2593643 RepID=UPI0010FD64B5|nr:MULTISPECIES: zinc-binding dehydrogenase [unclassified Nonomuraea]NBE96556.1 zinc-binding dehydrogenase [Nonomuraea sp. K271]TLF86342.1 zinc-binding dehydrogenase [Nonomuraea sp. KC401]
MSTTMVTSHGRCAVLEEPRGPEGLRMHKRALPDPPPGKVSVRLRASGLNHLDLWVVNGAQRVRTPRVIAADGAGEVVASAVEGWSPGDEVVLYPVAACWRCANCKAGRHIYCSGFAVLGEHAEGTACEVVQLPARNLVRKPAALPWAQAGALPLAFLTAWRMLVSRGRLTAGETLLVVGASGAVGTASVLIGAHLGARVLATTRDLGKAEELRALGAVEVFASDGFSRKVIDHTDGDGADVVIDHVGAATFDESLRSATVGGRVVTCGATTGGSVQLNLPRVFVRQLEILGSTTGTLAEFEDLVAATEAGLRPVIAREFGLEEIRDALTYLQSSDQIGKVILRQ